MAWLRVVCPQRPAHIVGTPHHRPVALLTPARLSQWHTIAGRHACKWQPALDHQGRHAGLPPRSRCPQLSCNLLVSCPDTCCFIKNWPFHSNRGQHHRHVLCMQQGMVTALPDTSLCPEHPSVIGVGLCWHGTSMLLSLFSTSRRRGQEGELSARMYTVPSSLESAA